jgi:hypothetical protein
MQKLLFTERTSLWLNGRPWGILSFPGRVRGRFAFQEVPPMTDSTICSTNGDGHRPTVDEFQDSEGRAGRSSPLETTSQVAPVSGVEELILQRFAALVSKGGNGRAAAAGSVPLADADNGPAAGRGEPSPLPNGDNGRDRRGRFAKGNRGGPGNPFARRIAAFRRALCEVVSEDDMHNLGRRLLDQVKAGNLVAAKLLLAYTIGRPTDAVDPDTLDLNEWMLYQKGPARPEEVAGILDRMPLEMTCELVRLLLPCVGTTLGQELLEQLNGTAKASARPSP